MTARIAGAEYTVHNVQLTSPIKRISNFDYVIYLINMSDRVFVIFNPNGKNSWFSIPHTGRTC